MTTYFDMNIPTHQSKPHLTNVALKSLTLGYTSIAHTKTIKGVMSDRDICSLSPPLSLSLIPSLSLHRHCLNLPTSSHGFRQYTRLTVCVETLVQAQALNSGNSVLKSYDVVAARPLSQAAFEHVCHRAEVDIIAIDFSEKLPFRLKPSSVEAAVKRGVYFEITYSGLIANPQARQQIIPNAKLLVSWTRGRNIILSSGAISASDLRGPIDVANLASLLGLSMERAKDAISKNCRNLVTSSLRKKKYYKEAIKVELVSSTEQSNESCFSDWLNWDPISSGDGDLPLDEIAKSFAASGKVVKNVKAINFAKVVDSLPSHGFRLGHVISGAEVLPESLNEKISLPAAQIVEVCTPTKTFSDQHPLPEPNQTSLCDISSEYQSSGCQSPPKFLNNNPSKVLPKIQEDEPCTTSSEPCEVHVEEEGKVSDQMDVHITIAETNVHEMQSQKQVRSSEFSDVLSGDTRDIEVAASFDANGKPELACLSKENERPVSHITLLHCTNQRESELKDSNGSDLDFILTKPEEHELQLQNENKKIVSPDVELSKRQREDKDSDNGSKRHKNDADFVDEVPSSMFSDEMIEDKQVLSVANFEPSEQVTLGARCREEDNRTTLSGNLVSISGKRKPKKRTSRKTLLLPLKSMLMPIHYKKKAKKHKRK